MNMRPILPGVLALALAVILASACDQQVPTDLGGGATEARTGWIQVTTLTTGSLLGSGDYDVRVDGQDEGSIGINDTTTLERRLAVGQHEVELVGLPSNCRVSGDNPRTVTVAADATVAASFEVDCIDTTHGSIEVTTLTSGISLDPDGYRITVDGQDEDSIGINDTTTLARPIEIGWHDVALTGLALNCHVDGANPQAVGVLMGSTVTANFEVDCLDSAHGWIRATVATEGASLDADGYSVTLDGEDESSIGISETVAFTRPLDPGDHDVKLTGLASNCAADANPQSATVAAAETVSVRFHVECTFVPRELAFTTQRDDGDPEIYAIDVGAFNPVRLTDDPALDLEPAWSPDGTEIAFASDRNGGGIWVMDAGGSNPMPLSQHFDLGPAWSPDGTKIAFSRDDSGWFEFHLYVMNADGSDPVSLAPDLLGGGPAWSPDGRKLAFTVDTVGSPDGRAVYVMDADGSNRAYLADGYGAAWSPDGTKIAFATDRDGNAEVYVMNADGSNPVNISNNPARDYDPAWSPDGTRIAFTTDRDGNLEVYVMNADGSNPVNVTDHPGPDYGPAWLH